MNIPDYEQLEEILEASLASDYPESSVGVGENWEIIAEIFYKVGFERAENAGKLFVQVAREQCATICDMLAYDEHGANAKVVECAKAIRCGYTELTQSQSLEEGADAQDSRRAA
jgi:hypothetical protein